MTAPARWPHQPTDPKPEPTPLHDAMRRRHAEYPTANRWRRARLRELVEKAGAA